MPSKRVSSARVDYVPALCTHRPSLLPIEWLSEDFGLARGGWQRPPQAGKLYKLGHLEEVKVVTRLILRTLAEAFAAGDSSPATINKPVPHASQLRLATLSNCGEPLRALHTKPAWETSWWPIGNYGVR